MINLQSTCLTCAVWGVMAMACGPSIPSVDACDDATDVTVDSLTLGEDSLDSVFNPWSDEGQRISTIVGSQGGEMIPLKFEVSGTTQRCIEVHTIVSEPDFNEVANERVTLRFYPQSDGSFLTETHYLIVELGEQRVDSLVLEARVGGTSKEYPLRVIR